MSEREKGGGGGGGKGGGGGVRFLFFTPPGDAVRRARIGVSLLYSYYTLFSRTHSTRIGGGEREAGGVKNSRWLNFFLHHVL